MSKHTPGPWKYSEWHDGGFAVDQDTADKWSAVCDVRPNTLGSRPVDAEEAEANARLITASPELLAVCDEMIEHVAKYGALPRSADKLLGRAMAAVSKAKGK